MHDYQLHSFIRAAHLGSFSRAAKEDFIAVQTFALRINTLEQELGFELFTRTSQGVTLTPAGEDYLRTAESVLGLLSHGKARAQGATESARRKITIGYEWKILPAVQEIFLSYMKLHPEIELDYVFTRRNDVEEYITQKRIDVAFDISSNADVSGDVKSIIFGSQQLALAVAPSSDLARFDSVSPDQLEGRTIYFGLDYSKIPALQFIGAYFPKNSVVTQSLPGEAVIMNCLQDANSAALFTVEWLSLADLPLTCVGLDGCPPIPSAFSYHAQADEDILEFVDYLIAGYKAMLS